MIFVCTFDLDQDLLTYSDWERGHIQLPLARLRKPNYEPVQRSEFTPFEMASPPVLDLTRFPPPYHTPSTSVPERHFAFSSRILSDFAEQWGHILKSSYAEPTWRRLAKAIIRIATCDFQVDEISTARPLLERGPYSGFSMFRLGNPANTMSLVLERLRLFSIKILKLH